MTEQLIEDVERIIGDISSEVENNNFHDAIIYTDNLLESLRGLYKIQSDDND